MFNMQIGGEMAVSFYLMAKGIHNVSVDLLILVWKDIHNREDGSLTIEFSKLKKQAYAERLHIKEDMVNKHLKRLIDSGFLTPITGYRGAYTYNQNAELDYIMCNMQDSSFVITIATDNDYNILNNCNSDYNNNGILEYNKSDNRFTIVYPDSERQTVYLYVGYKLEVKINGEWIETEMQFSHKSKKWILKKPDNSVKGWPRKLDGLEVRSIE